jgi:hypothetical protein
MHIVHGPVPRWAMIATRMINAQRLADVICQRALIEALLIIDD